MNKHHPWRLRFSFRNATIFVCFINVIAVILLLKGFLAYSGRKNVGNEPDPALLRYVMEAGELRRAMEPLELIRRVREIQQEGYRDPEALVQGKDPKKTAAIDLSKRLNKMHAQNDANSKKALEEWRKRKMERSKMRQMEKNGTASTPQA